MARDSAPALTKDSSEGSVDSSSQELMQEKWRYHCRAKILTALASALGLAALVLYVASHQADHLYGPPAAFGLLDYMYALGPLILPIVSFMFILKTRAVVAYACGPLLFFANLYFYVLLPFALGFVYLGSQRLGLLVKTLSASYAVATLLISILLFLGGVSQFKANRYR